MELWTVTDDLVPWNHEYYVKHHTYRPWDGVELLEITPEWVYGADGAEEVIRTSNNYVARVELAAYSDGMGENCADHISVERGMLCVPLWRDDEKGPRGGYHPAAIVGLSLIARMDDYPLLDEDDYSERETDAWMEYFEDELRWLDDGEGTDSHHARFMEYCWEHFVGYYAVYDVPSDDIERAYMATKENDNA